MSQIEDSQHDWENSVRTPQESIESNIKIIGQRYQIIQELDSEATHRIFLAEDKDIMSNPLCLIKQISYGESEPIDSDGNQINWQEMVSLQNQLAHILHHVVIHGMQHRSEAAAILTDYGHSPGNIDFIIFLRDQS